MLNKIKDHCKFSNTIQYLNMLTYVLLKFVVDNFFFLYPGIRIVVTSMDLWILGYHYTNMDQAVFVLRQKG